MANKTAPATIPVKMIYRLNKKGCGHTRGVFIKKLVAIERHVDPSIS